MWCLFSFFSRYNSTVPSQPSEFKGEAKSETSILLSWVAPPQGGPDNQITGYELVYRRADDSEEVGIKCGTSFITFDWWLGGLFGWANKFLCGQMDDNRLEGQMWDWTDGRAYRKINWCWYRKWTEKSTLLFKHLVGDANFFLWFSSHTDCSLLSSEENELWADHLPPAEEPEALLHLHLPAGRQKQARDRGVYQRSVHGHAADA